MGSRGAKAGDYSIPDFDINYGLGDRIQLKYELPIAVHEVRGNTGNLGQYSLPTREQVDVSLGESLLGVKWRFYQHLPASTNLRVVAEEAPEVRYSVSTYPSSPSIIRRFRSAAEWCGREVRMARAPRCYG
jgi:hypothetical protein